MIAIILMLISMCGFAQKKWAGPVAGYWADAGNWQPAGIPGASDNILLDNSLQPNNFLVTMPDGTVEVHSLSIVPSADSRIEVVIPVSNKGSPAVIIDDNGASFSIGNGGTFRNSSGLTSGQSIQTAGTISIFDGGRYVHNSRSSHAMEIVARLSTAAGTERGIFEFDVPGGSYPISISNRSYGTLVLSANASGGVQTYNASGSNLVTLNGYLKLNEGVQFNLDVTSDMIINGDYIQKGGVFNVASQPNSNVIKIKGNVSQAFGATIAETSSGLPVIELNGSQTQSIAFAGDIANSVAVRINNSQGIYLTNPMKISFRLDLAQGAITTSRVNLLTVLDDAVISGGSVNSFISGPIRKIGDDDFEFPVGKQGDYAPIKMIGSGGAVSDAYIAEYFLGDPGPLYGYSFETPPVLRISRQEYWTLERPSGISAKRLGVYVGNYSNATALKDLVVMRWDAGAARWRTAGNSFYNGIATGTLISDAVNDFGVFTLGSVVEMQNPLLINKSKLQSSRIADKPGLFLSVQGRKNEVVNFIVGDLNGRRVATSSVALGKGHNIVELPSRNLSRGIYVVGIYGSDSKLIDVVMIELFRH